jgi:hypothetical protein
VESRSNVVARCSTSWRVTLNVHSRNKCVKNKSIIMFLSESDKKHSKHCQDEHLCIYFCISNLESYLVVVNFITNCAVNTHKYFNTIINRTLGCEISGSHGEKYEDSLHTYSTMYSRWRRYTFQRCELPPSSFTALWWRQHTSLKCWSTSTRLHYTISRRLSSSEH